MEQALGHTAAGKHEAFTTNAGDFGFDPKTMGLRILREQAGLNEASAGGAAHNATLTEEEKEQKKIRETRIMNQIAISENISINTIPIWAQNAADELLQDSGTDLSAINVSESNGEMSITVYSNDGEAIDVPLTIEQKSDFETERGVSIFAFTQDEHDLNDFMRDLKSGGSPDIPEAMQRMVAADPTFQGRDINTLTHEDFTQVIKTRLGGKSASNVLAPNDLPNISGIAMREDIPKGTDTSGILPKGTRVPLTTDQVITVENRSQACSAGQSREMIDMTNFMQRLKAGEKLMPPKAMQDLIAKNPTFKNSDIEDLTREDYVQILQEKYSESPNIYSRIISSDLKLTTGSRVGTTAANADGQGIIGATPSSIDIPWKTATTTPAVDPALVAAKELTQEATYHPGMGMG